MVKKKLLAVSLAAIVSALGVAACGGSSYKAPVPVNVSLIGLNDFHGNLLPPTGSVTMADPANPAGTRVSAGGIAFLSTLVNELKAQNPGNTLVVAAGDMIGGTPINSALFHDEPAIEAMNLLGLDVSSVGNHEFDKGRDELLRMQNGGCFPKSADGSRGNVGVDTCMNDGKFSGAKFKYLAANVIDQKTGNTLFPSYTIKSVSGVDIGFIGLTLKDTPSVVTPSGVAGLSFVDEVETVNKLVPELKKQGVSAIVVLIHQGGQTTSTTVNDKSCPGLNGEIVSLVDKLDSAIDVVVSGHTHMEYNCVRPDGKILTQTGSFGRMATKIDLQIEPLQRKVLSKSANNYVAVNDVVLKDSAGKPIALPAGVTVKAKDSAMAAFVQRYVDKSAPITNALIGKLEKTVTRTQNTAGESQMGDIVADIYLNGANGAAFGDKGAVIAFSNVGGIRSDLSTSLDVTYGQLFTVMPFGNNLTLLDLTGEQIVRLLEQQWEAPQPANGRIMQVSKGFSYTWDASKPTGAASGAGNRVVAGSVKLNGVPLEMSKTYRVVVNNFMATGGDNFSVLKQGKNVQQADVDIDAGVAYFKKLGTVPFPGQDRISRIN
ncbi:bifunctional metallophosphatase/5'-nucleotidase [Massilia sp. W12]|uniref:bifunctional metallophosphatase/5'-nucleotidase n=1 Tax=Massilia sp. W12 TaxID=3126507 RepID=UPI0030CE2AB6